MNKYVIIYILCGLLSWSIVTPMMFHNLQGGHSKFERKISYRSNLGFTMIWGFVFGGLLWPIGLPTSYCVTGFAEFGIWTQK